ncbi:MAG: hypothetical protein R6U86_01190 [Bacteroidales bacterium]
MKNHFSRRFLFAGLLIAMFTWQMAPSEGLAQARSARSKSKSESQPHDGKRKQRYTPPRSSSRAVGSRAPKIDWNGSQAPFIENKPREPLKPSQRDIYYGVGRTEMGLTLGAAHAFTDIIGKSGTQYDIMDFAQRNASLMGGVYVRQRVNYWFGLNLGLEAARLHSSNPEGFNYVFDEDTENGSYNLSEFRNDIAGAYAKMEFYVPGDVLPGLQAFGFVGIAGYLSNPRVFGMGGDEVMLDTHNPLIVPTLPMGLGLAYFLGDRFKLGYEFNYQYVGRRSLDGISVRTSGYDSMIVNQLRIGFMLPPKRIEIVR